MMAVAGIDTYPFSKSFTKSAQRLEVLARNSPTVVAPLYASYRSNDFVDGIFGLICSTRMGVSTGIRLTARRSDTVNGVPGVRIPDGAGAVVDGASPPVGALGTRTPEEGTCGAATTADGAPPVAVAL